MVELEQVILAGFTERRSETRGYTHTHTHSVSLIVSLSLSLFSGPVMPSPVSRLTQEEDHQQMSLRTFGHRTMR
jgi:hypothetical protein